MQAPTHTTPKKAGRTVTRNIHVLRKDHNFGVETFADVTGLAASTVRRAERAYRERRPYNPQLSTLVKLSAATGVSLDDMVGSFLQKA